MILNALDAIKKFFGTPQIGIKIYDGEDFDSAELIPCTMLEVEHINTQEMSSIPLEGTKYMTDNLRVMPAKVNIRVRLSNQKTTLLIGRLNPFGKDEVRTGLKRIESDYGSNTVVGLVTLTRTIKKMKITSHTYKEMPENQDKYVTLDLSLEEILTYEKLKYGLERKAGVTSNVTTPSKSFSFNSMIKRFAGI